MIRVFLPLLGIAVSWMCCDHTLYAVQPGSLVAWGWDGGGLNSYGQLDVPDGDDFVAVAAGQFHSVALRSDGTLAAWGKNDGGQCIVPAGNDFVSVEAARDYCLAIKSVGSLVGWGINDYHQCEVPAGNDYVAVDGGGVLCLAIRADGSLKAWGSDFYNVVSGTPAGVDFVGVAAGHVFAVALKSDGTLVAWGDNSHGQCDVPTGNDFIAVAAEGANALALRSNGSLAAWGDNTYGQNDVPAFNDFITMDVGQDHCAALRNDGSVVTWGTHFGVVYDVPEGVFSAICSGGHHSVVVGAINEAPTAEAGDDQVVECTCPDGAVVQLNGSGSDPDSDELTYEWAVAENTAQLADYSDPQTLGTFPVGEHLLTLTVTDGNGGVAVDDVLITVVDTTPPTVVLTTDRIALWPPKHQMVQVEIALVVSDACTNPEDLVMVGLITSNEPDDGYGDGSFSGDIDLLDDNGGQDGFTQALPLDFVYDPVDHVFRALVDLRAERNGADTGRSYSITCDILDASGNLSTATCVVVVPHDKRKN